MMEMLILTSLVLPRRDCHNPGASSQPINTFFDQKLLLRYPGLAPWPPPVPHPAIPVLAERGGTQLKTRRPVVLVDTREQNPSDFSRFEGWFTGIEKKSLKSGDYSVVRLEDVCVVERKDLPDLIRFIECRARRLCESSAPA
jgi:hypothetical protein